MDDLAERLRAPFAGRYNVQHELGRGGMAHVFLAHDAKYDRRVAIKVLKPELAQALGSDRFLREIRLTAQIDHPHILPLLDSGEAEGFLYYVMPYVEGETLRDRLNREKQLPLDDALQIAREVADALSYAHRRGIVHRDIKPENILLAGGHARVADFGIARAVTAAGGATLTETGIAVGTPAYMSPEQAGAEKEVDGRSDVYSLGCVVYEMLAGHPPFIGSTVQEVLARHSMDTVPSLAAARPMVPEGIKRAIATALAKVPADRFRTAGEFANSLAAASLVTQSPGAGVEGRPRALSAPRSRWVRRNIRATAPWLVTALAIGVVVWTSLRPKPPPPPEVRFTAAAPDVDVPSNSLPTLSPDGSRVVFMARDSEHVQRLYVWSLQRERPTPIPGTEGAAGRLSFSPDGRWVAFYQQGSIRKVSLVTSAAVTLCDSMFGGWLGIAWSSADVIVFSVGGTLYVVDASGGRPKVLVPPDTAQGGVGLGSPVFLPDGQALLAARATPSGADLVVISLAKRSITPLAIRGLTPQFVDDGYLLYTDLSGTAFAVPFDARRLRVTGGAVSLVKGVAINRGAFSGAFARLSASRTGTLVYSTDGDEADLDIVLVDRRGRVQQYAAQPNSYRSPRFSPDGRRIAFVSGPFWGDIWTLDLESHRSTRLTVDSSDAFPAWSPDGRFLVFAKRGSPVRLYRVASDGSADPQSFLSRPNSVYESQITPDGRMVVFREDDPRTGRDILVAPVDSPTRARPIAATTFNERALAVSPDGRWLAFTSDLSGTDEIYVRRLEEGSARWRVSTGGGNEARWGALGRELFYRSGDSVYVVPITLGTAVQVGKPRVLFGDRYEVGYDVAPNGRQFVMIRYVGSEHGLTLHVVLHLFDQLRAGRGATSAEERTPGP